VGDRVHIQVECKPTSKLDPIELGFIVYITKDKPHPSILVYSSQEDRFKNIGLGGIGIYIKQDIDFNQIGFRVR
jgi:hypothetical protein